MTNQASSLLFLVVVAYHCCCVSGFTSISKISSRPGDGLSLTLLPPEQVANLDWLTSSAGPSSAWISETTSTVADNDDVALLSNQAIIATFVIGVIPFAVATVEFWRRIAVGDSFGTESDSVVIIGEDDAPRSSRGRRVLGKGALVTAYILFGIAAGVLGIVLYAVFTSGAPADIATSLPSSSGAS